MRGTYYVDLGWEGVRLAVEFDGAVKYDDDPEAVRQTESARQEALEAAGWTVVARTLPRDVVLCSA
ncbi:DUF559 domain-containing protein [Krasilnikoviella flava]|uniref:DUF559 domain-containing protein n=1 Tax=Krasilnikoviella flava TaxID=526729 RepID=UPI00111BDD24|nr:DUF559 domain-containing protein [Krasilnikoviella flava]